MINLIFFDYCFYRIARSKLFYKQDKKAPYLAAGVWVTMCQVWNITAIITIYHIIYNTTYDFVFVFIPIFLILCLFNGLFFLTKNKYDKLVISYKDEKHKKIKGWGVFLYVISSILLWVFVMIKLFWVPVQ